MKRETLHKKTNIANNILFYIYTHIETNISIDELAHDMGVSKFYMHKIFKEIFGQNIYESIKSIRLQKASNLLLTNQYSTISQIASLCGYSSQTSFLRAFKERFNMTPKEWKKGGYKKYSQTILEQSTKAKYSQANFDSLVPKIEKIKEFESHYIRNKGYNEEIKATWQKIETWRLFHDINDYQYIALFHDNPTITPLQDCQYVACIKYDDIKYNFTDALPKFKISGGTYAKFEVKGESGDLLKFIHWVYHEWLVKNDYETTTKPPFVVYKKSHYFSDDNEFVIDFYLSIKY